MNYKHQMVSTVGVTVPQVDGIVSVEDFIIYCARVSNDDTQKKNENNSRLLKYLIRNNHWSPFEMANITMEITTTRDIARQILRHRSFSFQEKSQRYSEAFPSVLREARLQDYENRQNSIDLDPGDDLLSQWAIAQSDLMTYTEKLYKDAIEAGVAKEQARAILPEGLTLTKMYMNGTLRSWIHYCNLRCANGTQREHMDVANKCRTELIRIVPSLDDYFSQED